jgi:hypothetical protein
MPEKPIQRNGTGIRHSLPPEERRPPWRFDIFLILANNAHPYIEINLTLLDKYQYMAIKTPPGVKTRRGCLYSRSAAQVTSR